MNLKSLGLKGLRFIPALLLCTLSLTSFAGGGDSERVYVDQGVMEKAKKAVVAFEKDYKTIVGFEERYKANRSATNYTLLTERVIPNFKIKAQSDFDTLIASISKLFESNVNGAYISTDLATAIFDSVTLSSGISFLPSSPNTWILKMSLPELGVDIDFSSSSPKGVLKTQDAILGRVVNYPTLSKLIFNSFQLTPETQDYIVEQHPIISNYGMPWGNYTEIDNAYSYAEVLLRQGYLSPRAREYILKYPRMPGASRTLRGDPADVAFAKLVHDTLAKIPVFPVNDLAFCASRIGGVRVLPLP